jgi:hypothetical protein
MWIRDQVLRPDMQTGRAIGIPSESRKPSTDSVCLLSFYPTFLLHLIVLLDAIAKLLVYSISVDGPVRQDAAPTPRSKEGRFEAQQTGFLEGSKALDSLDRLITSTESFFHPSNSGPWTMNVSNIIPVVKDHLMPTTLLAH